MLHAVVRGTNRIAGALAITAICATCDASSLVAPAGVEEIVLSFAGDTVLSVGRLIVPEVEVTVDGRPLIDPRLSYTSSNPSVVEITPGGQLYLRRLGTASVSVTLRSSLMPASPPTASWNLHVVAESLSVSTSALSFSALGATAVIAASAFDFNGLEIEDPPLRWESSSPETVAVTQSGIVTAKGGGTADVRAILGPDTATVSVTVAQTLTQYTLSHDDVTFESLGDTLRVIATARDANGGIIAPSPTSAPVWTSRDPSTVDVTQGGKITARRNASTWVVAQRGAIADSVRLTVNQLAVRVVISSATGFGIDAIDGQLALTARGFDANNNPDVNSPLTWSSLDPAGAQVHPDSGVVTGRTTGDHRIVAAVDNAADTVVVNVNNPPASLVLTPATVAMTSVGDTTQLAVVTLNSRGAPVSAEVTWRSTDETVVRIVPGSRIESRGIGSARVIASTTARIDPTTEVTFADTTTVTVTNDPTVITIPATSLALTWVGQTSSPAITIRNARGDALPLTSITWSSDDATVATVSDAGLITAAKSGTTTVRATFGAIGDSLRVTVTNDPASIVLTAERDTMTALGRTIAYAGDVRNEGGVLLTPFAIAWRSTATNVATVSTAGVVTSVQNGSAMIIGQAGPVADTIAIVVRNPTVLWVDNSVVAAERFGTLTRPYAKIQDGVAAAEAGDTVIVRRGFGYSESVALSRRITLLGDSAAYVAGGRNPALLPAIAHDTGSAGITGTTTAQLVIRYFALTHSLDGPAINTSGADVRIEHFYVNPGSSAIKLGRGILVRDAPTFAVLADIAVRNVRGYGIRLERVTQGQIDRATVQGVDSVSGTRGAGIDVYRGSINDVRTAIVREAQGPGVLLDSTSSASVLDGNFAGRSILVRVRGVSGAITVIERNRFDLGVLSGATDTRGSVSDGRSGLEIVNSSNVQVRQNTFTESGTALMDGIRLINAKGGGAFLGVTMFRNQFAGGRYSVRSERSSWTMTESRSEGAVTPVFATDADTIQLASDTLIAATGDACVSSTGSVARLDISGSLIAQCGTAGTVGGRAIRVAGNTNVTLVVRTTTMSGPNQTAVHFSGRDLTLRGNVMSGRGTRTVTGFIADGVIDAAATSNATISGNTITDYVGLTAATLTMNVIAVDSNIVARNGTGLHLLGWLTLSATDNDFSDHEVVAVRNGRSIAAPFGGNWWGDSRGPRRTTVPAATGDSVAAFVTIGTVRAAPLNPGTTASSLRMVRGNGQTAVRRAVLPTAFTVRVVDDQGRPVAGTTVAFTVTDGNGSVSNASVATDASGLAETTLTLGNSAGNNAVRASISAPGSPTSVTFTATGTP
jgi:hypothetical protein